MSIRWKIWNLGLNSLQSTIIDTTQETIKKISSIFSNRFYVEIDRTNRTRENEYNNIALSIAKEHDLPIVASNDVLFMTDSDYEANEVKVSIIQKTKLDDRVNQDDFSPNQYFKSEDEMSTLFNDYASALENIFNIVRDVILNFLISNIICLNFKSNSKER